MREYIPKRIPEEAYKRTVSICRDLERMKALSAGKASLKKGAGLNEKTRLLAVERVEAYERVIQQLHEGERYIVEQNIIHRVPMTYIQSPYSLASMKRLKSDFIKRFAKELGEI
jgi:hypothetical protein